MSEEAKHNVVPFGKYRGQPIDVLRQDQDYLNWLAAQDWFRQRYAALYATLVAEPTETPEAPKATEAPGSRSRTGFRRTASIPAARKRSSSLAPTLAVSATIRRRRSVPRSRSRMVRAACRPSMPGRRLSISTRSYGARVTASTASRPLPTTSTR